MSFTDDMRKMLGSYEEIPREGQKKSNPAKENSLEMPKSDLEKMMNSYEKVPREEQKKTDPVQKKTEGIVKEVKAIQDMRRILYLLEKKIRGTLAEADKQEIRESMERWEGSMEILCEYAGGDKI